MFNILLLFLYEKSNQYSSILFELMSLEQKSVLLTDAENRGNIEAVMDYILAWTLKMCDPSHYEGAVDKSLLLECRKIMSKLIGVDVTAHDCAVETYFEWKKIDLVVEVHLGDREYHTILIENKVKAYLPPHELATNKRVFKEYYDADNECIQHFILLCAYSPVPQYMIEQSETDGFNCITLEELTDYNAPDVGNAIFDEFWRRTW